MTRAELVARIENEGGILDAISYGIRVADLPDDTPTEIQNAWFRLQAAADDEDLIADWLECDG